MASNDEGRECKNPSLRNYPTIQATFTTMSKKNFKRAINFQEKEKLPCKDIWKTNVRESHIRNKNLRDLPFSKPKCCSDVYNIVLDRQKLKKLQKYNMSRPVRTIQCNLEPAEKPKFISNRNERFHQIYECETSDDYKCGNDDESDDGSYVTCESGSLVDCTGCDTLGGGQTLKRHLKEKKIYEKLSLRDELKKCREFVIKEMTKYKGEKNAKLKLQKYSSS